MNRDGYNLMLRVLPSGTLWLSWQQLRASHQIRLESFREPGLGTARIDFSDCTAIFRINWPLDLVGYTGLRILLTRIIRGDWSGTVQLATLGCVGNSGELLIRLEWRRSESLDFVQRE